MSNSWLGALTYTQRSFLLFLIPPACPPPPGTPARPSPSSACIICLTQWMPDCHWQIAAPLWLCVWGAFALSQLCPCCLGFHFKAVFNSWSVHQLCGVCHSRSTSCELTFNSNTGFTLGSLKNCSFLKLQIMYRFICQNGGRISSCVFSRYESDSKSKLSPFRIPVTRPLSR